MTEVQTELYVRTVVDVRFEVKCPHVQSGKAGARYLFIDPFKDGTKSSTSAP